MHCFKQAASGQVSVASVCLLGITQTVYSSMQEGAGWSQFELSGLATQEPVTNKSSVSTVYIFLPLPFLHVCISCFSRLLRKEFLYFLGVKCIGSPFASNEDNFADSTVAWPEALLLDA